MDPARPVPFGVSQVDPTVAPKQTWPLPRSQGARPVATGQWIPGESQGRCLGHRDDQVSVHLEKRKLPSPSAREEPEGPSERSFPALLRCSPPSRGSLLWLVRSPLQPAARGMSYAAWCEPAKRGWGCRALPSSCPGSMFMPRHRGAAGTHSIFRPLFFISQDWVFQFWFSCPLSASLPFCTALGMVAGAWSCSYHHNADMEGSFFCTAPDVSVLVLSHICAWRTSVNISPSTGLMAMFFSAFVFVKKSLFHFHFWKILSLSLEFWVNSCSFNTLKMLLHYFLAWILYDKKSENFLFLCM